MIVALPGLFSYLFFLKYGFISFDKGDRNGHAGMYLHCSDRGLDG